MIVLTQQTELWLVIGIIVFFSIIAIVISVFGPEEPGFGKRFPESGKLKNGGD